MVCTGAKAIKIHTVLHSSGKKISSWKAIPMRQQLTDALFIMKTALVQYKLKVNSLSKKQLKVLSRESNEGRVTRCKSTLRIIN